PVQTEKERNWQEQDRIRRIREEIQRRRAQQGDSQSASSREATAEDRVRDIMDRLGMPGEPPRQEASTSYEREEPKPEPRRYQERQSSTSSSSQSQPAKTS